MSPALTGWCVAALAVWGDTKGWDGTAGLQPHGTVFRSNIVHELGLYEKQSSAFAHNKAHHTTIERNVIYNMPRAGINLNDGLGGGNVISSNIIFNTCRESGAWCCLMVDSVVGGR